MHTSKYRSSVSPCVRLRAYYQVLELVRYLFFLIVTMIGHRSQSEAIMLHHLPILLWVILALIYRCGIEMKGSNKLQIQFRRLPCQIL